MKEHRAFLALAYQNNYASLGNRLRVWNERRQTPPRSSVMSTDGRGQSQRRMLPANGGDLEERWPWRGLRDLPLPSYPRPIPGEG